MLKFFTIPSSAEHFYNDIIKENDTILEQTEDWQQYYENTIHKFVDKLILLPIIIIFTKTEDFFANLYLIFKNI